MVKVYLLLRNNKQSGPFSLEELTTQKLRPMDLIWIEGKSAAWQYASEVNVLKGYIPETDGITNATPNAHSAYLPKNETADPTPSPKIHVSLPGSARVEKKEQLFNQPFQANFKENKPEPVRPVQTVQPGSQDQHPTKDPEPVRPVQTVHPPEFKEKLITKYSSSLDEKEEAYTNWVYQKKSKKSSLSTELMGGIAVVVLLLMGTAAYLVKNNVDGNKGNVLTATATRNTEELVTTAPPPDPVVSQVSQNMIPLPKEHISEALPVVIPIEQAHTVKSPVVKPVLEVNIPAKKKASLSAQKLAPPVGAKKNLEQVAAIPPANNTFTPVSNPVEDNSRTAPAETAVTKTKKTFSEKVDGFFNRIIHAKKVEPGSPATGESQKQTEPPTTQGNRSSSRRDDPAVNRMETPKKDLSAGLAITTIESPNNWMQGVHGLKMKVDNRNDVKITNASVEVRYLNEQNVVIEKKTIRLTDIPAGKSITMAIPDQRVADHAEALLISASN